jgi:hypothetical protein
LGQFGDHVARDEVAKLRENRELAPGWSWVSTRFFFTPDRNRDRRNHPTPTAFLQFLWVAYAFTLLGAFHKAPVHQRVGWQHPSK